MTRTQFASSAIWSQRTSVGAALRAFMPRWHSALSELVGEQKPLRELRDVPRQPSSATGVWVAIHDIANCIASIA
jgi:hypothetical protein